MEPFHEHNKEITPRRRLSLIVVAAALSEVNSSKPEPNLPAVVGPEPARILSSGTRKRSSVPTLGRYIGQSWQRIWDIN